MRNLISWENIEQQSVYDQLKSQLEIEKNLDQEYITLEHYGPDELFDELELFQQEYEFYDQKLEFARDVNFDLEKQQRYFQIIEKINRLESLSEKKKIMMMLSYHVLLDIFSHIHNQTDEDILLLSNCSSLLDLDDYTNYIGVLCDSRVLEAIHQRTDDFNEKEKMSYAIMNAQDEFPSLDADNFEFLVGNAIHVALEYELPYTR